LIAPALRSDKVMMALTAPGVESLEFRTGCSGAVRLLDAADPGGELRCHSQLLRLEPGNYKVRAGPIDLPGLSIIVRAISKL